MANDSSFLWLKVGEGCEMLSPVGSRALVGLHSFNLLHATCYQLQYPGLPAALLYPSSLMLCTYYVQLHDHFQPLKSNISPEQQRHLLKLTPFYMCMQVKKIKIKKILKVSCKILGDCKIPLKIGILSLSLLQCVCEHGFYWKLRELWVSVTLLFMFSRSGNRWHTTWLRRV